MYLTKSVMQNYILLCSRVGSSEFCCTVTDVDILDIVEKFKFNDPSWLSLSFFLTAPPDHLKLMEMQPLRLHSVTNVTWNSYGKMRRYCPEKLFRKKADW